MIDAMERKQYEDKIEAQNQLIKALINLTMIHMADKDPDIRCPRCGSVDTEIIERRYELHALERYCKACGHHWITDDPNWVHLRNANDNLRNIEGQ